MSTTRIRGLLLSLVCGLAGASAHADLIFSNVNVTGSLSGGASFVASNFDIDFTFPDAVVGDPNDVPRFGNIVITFEVTGDMMTADQLLLSVGGALSGSGLVFFNEVVEDLVNPGVIATYNALLDENSDLPHVALLPFSRASAHIKVKKTLFLSAEDTQAFDLANVSLVQQNFIPEPASVTLLLSAALLAVRRR